MPRGERPADSEESAQHPAPLMAFTQRLEGRNLLLVAFGLAISLIIGVAAGIQPRYGVAAALGLTFAGAVLANVTVGVVMFTLLSFLGVVNAGSGRSASSSWPD